MTVAARIDVVSDDEIFANVHETNPSRDSDGAVPSTLTKSLEGITKRGEPYSPATLA